MKNYANMFFEAPFNTAPYVHAEILLYQYSQLTWNDEFQRSFQNYQVFDKSGPFFSIMIISVFWSGAPRGVAHVAKKEESSFMSFASRVH